MASWKDMGHGMRRRTGAPSSHLESTGKNMARNHMTADEHMGAAATAGSHRVPMGMDAYQVTATPALKGTLMPKKNVQAGDPTGMGTKQNRQNIEKIGASYRVAPKATFVQLDPSAGPTMASARVVPSVAGVNGSFQDAENTAFL
jgi:hypothetical protein